MTGFGRSRAPTIWASAIVNWLRSAKSARLCWIASSIAWAIVRGCAAADTGRASAATNKNTLRIKTPQNSDFRIWNSEFDRRGARGGTGVRCGGGQREIRGSGRLADRGRRRVRALGRQSQRRHVALNRRLVSRSGAVPGVWSRGAVDEETMLRRLRREPAAAVVDPDEEPALGRGQDIEIAVAIDVGGDDALQHHVVAHGDGARERRRVHRRADADDRAAWQT